MSKDIFDAYYDHIARVMEVEIMNLRLIKVMYPNIADIKIKKASKLISKFVNKFRKHNGIKGKIPKEYIEEYLKIILGE